MPEDECLSSALELFYLTFVLDSFREQLIKADVYVQLDSRADKDAF